jgi:hypothetical protein
LDSKLLPKISELGEAIEKRSKVNDYIYYKNILANYAKMKSLVKKLEAEFEINAFKFILEYEDNLTTIFDINNKI